MDLSSIVNGAEKTPKRSVSGQRRSTLASLLNGDTPMNDVHSNGGSENGEPRRTNSTASLGGASLDSEGPKRESVGTQVDDGPRKPKRYARPPVWALNWSGSSGRRANGQHAPKPSDSQFSSATSSVVETVASAGTGPGGLPSLLGIGPSISGVLPSNEITRKICNWLYSNLHAMEKNREHVEVEFKLGTICEKTTRSRTNVPVLSEAVLSMDYSRDRLFFVSDVSDTHFKRAEALLRELSNKQGQTVLTQLPELHTRDEIYPGSGPAGGPGSGGSRTRLSFNENNEIVDSIVKTRVSDMMIFSPGDMVDIRISISTEVPTKPRQGLPPPETIRRKNRQSWQTRGCQIDFTGVINEGSTTNQGSSKEIEIELDSKMLLGMYDSFQDRSDPQAMDKFQELVQFGMDNCRVIARHISREN